MKIEIHFFKKIEMEVDDKFNCLAVDDPLYEPLGADEENALFDELAEHIEKTTEKSCSWRYDKIPMNEDFICGVYRSKDNSPIMEW